MCLSVVYRHLFFSSSSSYTHSHSHSYSFFFPPGRVYGRALHGRPPDTMRHCVPIARAAHSAGKGGPR